MILKNEIVKEVCEKTFKKRSLKASGVNHIAFTHYIYNKKYNGVSEHSKENAIKHVQSALKHGLPNEIITLEVAEEALQYLLSNYKNENVSFANINPRLEFIDLFAGIGGIKLGFEQAGFKSVFSNDYDAYCKTTFDYNFSKIFQIETELYQGDVAQVPSEIFPSFEMLTGGFPCQPFSIAGYRKGFTDKGRGDLFFEIIRILKDRRPKVFMLENVKNLKTHDNGNTLKLIYDELTSLGYHVADAVLNTLEYGNLPQNRERIYIVGFLSENEFDKFSFPEKIPLTKTIHDCLDDNTVEDKYYYMGKPLYEKLKDSIKNENTVYQWRRQYVRENKSNVCPTLTANMGTGGHNVPIILDEKGIRKLTPRECANFQGFPKEYKLPKIADSQLYKQIGNSVSVPVVTRIAEKIKLALEND